MMNHTNIHTHKRCNIILLLLIFFASGVFTSAVQAANSQGLNANKVRVEKYWTPERMANAIPRDLVIDQRGQGYLRKPDGSLVPYGHQLAIETGSQSQTPFSKPPAAGGGGSADTTAPTVTNMDPAEGDTITATHTFSATVTDPSGVKSVSFVIRYPDVVKTQTFTASHSSGDTWTISLNGFSNGAWSWWVEAKDGAGKGGNSGSSTIVNFTVDTAGVSGSGGSSSSDTITNEVWSSGGAVQTAAGRLYFEMPANAKRKGPWNAYVCSGSVVTDGITGRSVILTAAHCVYDDTNKAFARNVLFIPDQAETTGSGTDLNCSNDPLGCWVPSFGVVDNNWSIRTFPDNIPWDYAYYVVKDETGNVLDSASEAGSLPLSFTMPYSDDSNPGAQSVDYTYALGYSYSYDPNFMYCAEDMTTEGSANWWLPSCGLSGGASGGPWVQPMALSSGSGSIISVNSWGYTTSPGMAGPKLVNNSASCLFEVAKGISFASVSTVDGDVGVVAVNYCQ